LIVIIILNYKNYIFKPTMTLSTASLVLADGDATEFGADHFQVSIAHYFIIGAALFSIFWGVVNAILVSIQPTKLTTFSIGQTSRYD